MNEELIFISYSRLDKEIVDPIHKRLFDNNFNVWMDREDIGAGDSWRAEIKTAIKTCSVFILMLSSNSGQSQYVESEFLYANQVNKKIFIVELEPNPLMSLELEFELLKPNRILVHDENYEPGLEKLVSELLKFSVINKKNIYDWFRKYPDNPNWSRIWVKKILVSPRDSTLLKIGVAWLKKYVSNDEAQYCNQWIEVYRIISKQNQYHSFSFEWGGRWIMNHPGNRRIEEVKYLIKKQISTQ